MLQKPRGTRDFLPDEMEFRREIEQRLRYAAQNWGYREVCTPTFETQELFTIRSGEGIIKEMYAFEDKGGRKLALRPEGTAPVLRMYVNEAQVLAKPIRWFYFADCYRYERPQKGRYRQFWQFGTELIGADTAAADAEIILLAENLLQKSGVEFEMHVGHLAPMKHLIRDLEPGEQKAAMAFLDKHDIEGLKKCREEQGNESLIEPLSSLLECRTLDEVFEATGDLPEKERMQQMIAILDAQGLSYTLDMGIVRGLDYYTGMVFEAFAHNLGAENQILGGGAYRLAHLFGGDDVASCGFGLGFDRVMASLGKPQKARSGVVAVVYTPEAQTRAFEVARIFREAGIMTELNLLERGIGAQMKHAGRSADLAVVIGKRECEAGTVTLKDLAKGTQEEVTPEEAVAGVKRLGAC